MCTPIYLREVQERHRQANMSEERLGGGQMISIHAIAYTLTPGLPRRSYSIPNQPCFTSVWSIPCQAMHGAAMEALWTCLHVKTNLKVPPHSRFLFRDVRLLVQTKCAPPQDATQRGESVTIATMPCISPPEAFVGSSWKNPPPSLEGVGTDTAGGAPFRADCGPDGLPPPPPAAPALPSSPAAVVPKRERNMLNYFDCAHRHAVAKNTNTPPIQGAKKRQISVHTISYRWFVVPSVSPLRFFFFFAVLFMSCSWRTRGVFQIQATLREGVRDLRGC